MQIPRLCSGRFWCRVEVPEVAVQIAGEVPEGLLEIRVEVLEGSGADT